MEAKEEYKRYVDYAKKSPTFMEKVGGPSHLKWLYWKSGLTCREIGQKYGISSARVRQLMVKHNIPRRGKYTLNGYSINK